MSKKTAVIDMGSNSCRMVIYEKTSRFSFQLLKEIKSSVKIGEGAYGKEGVLQGVPLQRAYDALKDFMQIAKSYGVRKTLCVATSALRDAPNAKSFINRVQKQLHLKIKVIDGQKEAYLGGLAAANLLRLNDRAITVDIGGGSTEFAVIEDQKVVRTISTDIGTLRIKELFFDKDRGDEASAYIDKIFSELNIRCSDVVCIGGTARAISKSIMKTMHYPLDMLHGYQYSVDEKKGSIEALLDADRKVLKKLKIKSDRHETIKPGTAIFLSALKALKAQRVITSGVGVREGLFLSDLLRRNNHRFPANFNPSVKNMVVKYSGGACKNVAKRALAAFEMFATRYKLTNQDRELLKVAATLVGVGNYVNIYKYNKIGEMLILNELNYGFTHQQIATIASLVRYSKNKLPDRDYPLVTISIEFDKLTVLSFLLSFALKINDKTEFALEDGCLNVECDYVIADALCSLEMLPGLKLNV